MSHVARPYLLQTLSMENLQCVEMKIACLQFNSQLGNLDYNLKRAQEILEQTVPADFDLLVLPEMAFSGYNFKSLQEIEAHLEPTTAGPSTDWARTVAMRLKCFVCVGYPEHTILTATSSMGVQRYNSCVLVNPQGEVVINYRKHFLFSTDETWAEEGKEGFFAGEVLGLGKIAIGICMDLNPYKFLAPFDKYEFANHVINSQVDLVILPMAWLIAQSSGALVEIDNTQEPNLDVLNYWVQRLVPLIDQGHNCGREITIVISNRIGAEGECNFAGTSVVLGLSKGNVKVHGCLGQGIEGLLVCAVPHQFP